MEFYIKIIIPVHNRKNLLESCLYSFRRQTYKHFEIIVVDDGSTDGTKQMLKNNFPEVKALKGNGNLWWTGSINKGIGYALSNGVKTQYILVINDDLEVYENYLENLIKVARNNPKTLIGSVTVNIDNPDIIDNGGELMFPQTLLHKYINKGKSLSKLGKDTIIQVSRLTGRGVLIPIEVFNDIGLYDEKHFKQCGDTEFTIRAKNKGYNLIVSYSAIIKSHVDSTATTNTNEYYSLKDFREKFFGIKSHTNVRDLFYYALNTSKNPFYFIYVFILNLVGSLYHYLIRLRFIKPVSNKFFRKKEK